MKSMIIVLLMAMSTLSGLAAVAQAQSPEQLPTLRSKEDNGWGVVLAQSLLNDCDVLETPLKADGKWGAMTLAAVKKLQKKTGLVPDGIVGPNTWAKLFADGRCRYVVKFKHPKWSDTTRKSNSPLYESDVQIIKYDRYGPHLEKSVSGSLKCDYSALNKKRVGVVEALKEHGVISNGSYELNLGFHKRPSDGAKPTADDLKVKTTGKLRPCLVVNRDNAIPCFSKKTGKTTSNFIHVHNGFVNGRDSSGCPTIKAGQWSEFVSFFIAKHKTVEDWFTADQLKYYGKSVGVLVISDK